VVYKATKPGFSLWATVCKTVRPMLSARRLFVCPVLSCPVCDVGVLWPTVGRIKMKLGMLVGLGPGHIVLDGDPASPKGRSPFSAHVRCVKRLHGWIKMSLLAQATLC